MKRTGRIRTVLLASALCVALLAGCGGSGNSVDLHNAKSLADLKGAKIAAQGGTFHESAL